MACTPGPVHSRFGAGHTLTLRVPPDQHEPATAFIETTFPGAELREAHGSRLRFQLPPRAGCTLARVFRELAAQGKAHGVEDFSVNQTTLEEVTSGTIKGLEGKSRGASGPWADIPPPCLSVPPCPPCQVFLYFSKDQGEEEEGSQQETEGGEVSTPGRQHLSRFLEDPSSVETMI